MLTGYDLSGGTAGVAFTGQICRRGGAAVGLDERGRWGDCFAAETLAHELGHSLGAHHDSTNNRCAASGFLMNARATPPVGDDCTDANMKTWSACSARRSSAEHP